MLLGNYSVLLKNPSRSSGGLAFSGTIAPWDSVYSLYTHEGYLDNLKYSSLPTATQDPYSWVLAPKSGGELSSTTSIRGTGSITGSLTQGGAISASMGGVGSFISSLGLLTLLTANLAGVGGLSASISASLGLASTLSGSSTLEGSLGMLVPLAGNLSGTGAISANLRGLASLSATIYVNQSEASVQQLVDGVWNAVATEYNNVGTMGEAAQTGGGGGGGGATAAQIWSYASRTLTESAGLTTEQAEQLTRVDETIALNLDKKVSEVGGGGGGFFNTSGIQETIRNTNKKTIEEVGKKIDEAKEEVISKIESEKLDIEPILDKIDSIKIPQTDLSPITTGIGTIKTQNTKLSQKLEGVKEGQEKLGQNLSKLSDRQEMTDKMIEREADEIERKIEENIEKEADDIESEIESQIKKEIQEIESNLQNNGNNNGTEG